MLDFCPSYFVLKSFKEGLGDGQLSPINFQVSSVSPETIFLDDPITSASYKVQNFLSSGFGLFPWRQSHLAEITIVFFLPVKIISKLLKKSNLKTKTKNYPCPH